MLIDGREEPSSHAWAVEVAGISRRFGGAGAPLVALDGVDLAVREGEFFSLLGPSGCGKTTLLRIIAGLEHPDSGSVRIGGADVDGVPAHRRPVNTVFQSYALFPHLSVRDNVAFGLRMKKVPQGRIAERVARALDVVQIAELAARRPAQLSGGQKQRVALARALVNEPRVLLLDEPLGALDLKLRKELQTELRALQRRLGITFLCVTHDQEEALVLSDRIAVMRAGKIEQLGAGRQLYERPRTRFVAGFLGSCNLVAGTIAERTGSEALVTTACGPLRVAHLDAAPPVGASVTLGIRPEKVTLSPGDAPAPASTNLVAVRVRDVVYVGAESRYLCDANGVALSAVAMNAGSPRLAPAPGQDAIASLPADALILLEES